MKRHYLFATLLLLLPATAYSQEAAAAQPNTALTVADVIALHDAQVTDAVIIAKLKQSGTPLELTLDDMMRLKQDHVSDAVVRAMIAPNAGTIGTRDLTFEKFHSMNPTGATLPYGTTTANPDDPLSAHDSGIYLVASAGDGSKLQFLERAPILGMSNNFNWAAILVIPSIVFKFNIQGPRAAVRTTDAMPTFYFYFEDKAAGLGKSAFANQTLSSPVQFQLVRVQTKKRERLMMASKDGWFADSNGRKPILFKTDRVRPGLYKVTFEQALKPGEYVFVAPGSSKSAAAIDFHPDLFDFAIDPEEKAGK